MTLFGSLVNSVLADFENRPGIAGTLSRELASRFQQNNGGGLKDMVEQLSKQGLGDIVQSWVGNGPNKDITAGQLGQSIDKNLLAEIAAKLGVSPQEVTTHLADVLPKLINQLTPDGKLPAGTSESPAETEAPATNSDF